MPIKPPPISPLNGEAMLKSSKLATSLTVACAVLANYLEAGTGEITAKQISMLPDALFRLAIDAHWIPAPHPNDARSLAEELPPGYVWLGDFVVEESFRDSFVALFDEVFRGLQPYNDEIGAKLWRDDAQRDMILEDHRLMLESMDDVVPVGPVSETDASRDSGVAGKPNLSPKQLIKRWQEQNNGLKLADLAAEAGVSLATINRIVSEKHSFSKHRESLKDVASVIGCDWQDLIPVQFRRRF